MDEEQQQLEQAEQPGAEFGQIIHAWMVDEYPVYHRPRIWYVMVILIGAGLVVYALVTLNFLFALILLIFGIILAISVSRKPVRVRFAVTEQGVQLGHRFIPWKEIAVFWFVYEPPVVKTIYFDFKSMIRPELGIPLENMNPTVIRKTLLEYIDEDLENDSEPLGDFLGRIFRV